MTFLYYVTILALISVVTAQYLEYRIPDLQTQPSNLRALQIPEYLESAQNPTLSYTLQLPREENPNVPFYNPELVTDQQPPSINNQNFPIFYEYPQPSVDLQVPKEGSWNPSNDPSLYYDNVPIVVEFETPTNLHPKKFDKSVHEKKYSGEPKKEFILQPVTSEELVQQHKAFEKLAKLENQKQIRTEKAQQAVQI